MGDRRFDIIFKGELIEGFDGETVKKNFETRFKVKSGLIERYFSGMPVVLKKEVDQSTAFRIKKAVTEAGGICHVQPIASRENPKKTETGPDPGFKPVADPPQNRSEQPPGDWPFADPLTGAVHNGPPTGHPASWSPQNSLANETIPAIPDTGHDQSRPPEVFDPASAYYRNREKKDGRAERAARIHRLGCMLAAAFGVLVLAGTAGWFWWQNRTVYQPPGILAAAAPIQIEVAGEVEPFWREGYQLTPMAEFRLKAMVLSRKLYREGPASDLSPLDLALGWGAMSDVSVLKDIEISQWNRFYFWRTQRPPIPLREIETSSANMHLIPASPVVWEKMKAARKGHIIGFRGYLVNVRGPGGWSQKSSLTRQDTGPNACEVVWVDDFQIF